MSTPPFDAEGIEEIESIPDGSGSGTGATEGDATEGDATEGAATEGDVASGTTSGGAPAESDTTAVPNK